VVQLYETMMTRHTTMVVGPTGGGKSVIINTLAQAQTKYEYSVYANHNADIVISVNSASYYYIKPDGKKRFLFWA